MSELEREHQRSGRDGRTPFGALLRAVPFSLPTIPGTGDPLFYPITSPGSDYSKGRGAAVAASSRWKKGPISHFQPVPVGTQHVWMFGHGFYVVCVTPRNAAFHPFGVDVDRTQGRQGCPVTPLPLLLEAAQNVWGVASRAEGPGARASGVPPPPATAPSPHPVSVDTLVQRGLCLCSPSLGGSGFTSKGGHVIPPPDPAPPLGSQAGAFA